MNTQDVERIVLVDDNEADNVYHEVVIRRSGFAGDLKTFESPEEALAYLKALPDGPVCLVLLDINMPSMTGWEFAQAAAPLLAQKPTIVLVMLTSSSAEEDLQRSRELEAVHGYLTKPLTRATVMELLEGQWSK